MKISPRFQAAISTIRPRGGRIVESFSPKLGRRLQCFGENFYRQWICLEADPLVEIFCERRFYLNPGDNKRVVDFWVRYKDREVLLVLEVEFLNSFRRGFTSTRRTGQHEFMTGVFETRRAAMDEILDWLTFYNHD